MNLSKILPPKPALVLERERLTNRLRSWEDRKLVVIHGQPGQGKSTLAAVYRRQIDTPSAWYNIDREDDDPSVFLSSLGQAIQRTWPTCIRKLPLVPNNRYGVGGMHQSINRWVAQVFGCLPDQSLIILDDCHATKSPAFKSILQTFIEKTPPHVRFMLLSRFQLDIEIAGLRAKRAVGEITGEDLKFSDEEVRDLFKTVFGIHLEADEASLINQTAEGWAAGLVLMHEYLQTMHPLEIRAALSGRHRTGLKARIFDFLAQEVFEHLPREAQNFLMRTSIVDYLTLPLMGLLAGLPVSGRSARPGVEDILEDLRKKNLFITSSDEGGAVVRYHALFREFLRGKFLSSAGQSDVRRLYSLAASYFEELGDTVRTIDLLIESGQFDRAMKRIESQGMELISSGKTRTVLRWIDELPPEYRDRPWFLFYRGVALRFTDPRRALSFFEQSFAKFSASQTSKEAVAGRMLSLGGIVEACFHAGGNFRRMEKAAFEAMALLKDAGRNTPEARARLLLAIGIACFFIGRLKQGMDALVQALEIFRKIGDHFYQIQSAIYLATCAIYAGDFRLAYEAIKKGFDAHAAIPDETGGEAALYMAMAMTSLFKGDFDEAGKCIDKCHSLAHEYELEAFDFLSLDIGGWHKIAVGEYEEAERLLLECKQKGMELNNAFFHSSSAHLLAVNYLHQGRIDDALKEAAFALAARKRLGSRLFSAVTLSALGVIYLKLGRHTDAAHLLAEALCVFKRMGAKQLEANVLLALASLRIKEKNEEAALKLLRMAFSIGEQQGFTYYYLFSRSDLRELARTALAAGILPEYCQKLIAGGKDAPWLKVFTLGGFRLERDGRVVSDSEWKGRMSRSFFKLLVAQAGRKISRDAVMDIFWPERGDLARPLLNNMLRRIRRLIDPPYDAVRPASCIIVEGDMLQLNLDMVWIDMNLFLGHIENAARLRDNDKARAIEEYEKAFALYQGDFVPDDLYEDWAIRARDRIRSVYFKALEDAADLCDMRNEKERAARYYERLFTADPCNENACRWLMSWHFASGRRSEAVRIYEFCERALKKELDVEPDTKTMALYRTIIGG